jgi:hypothetical protein
MNRAQEIATIDAHIAVYGVYRCTLGESFYGDENVPLRDRMANFCRNRGRPRKVRPPPRPCGHCRKPVPHNHKQRPDGKVYCDRACSDAERRAGRQTVNCAACGKKLSRPPSRIFGRSYCDNACRRGKSVK